MLPPLPGMLFPLPFLELASIHPSGRASNIREGCLDLPIRSGASNKGLVTLSVAHVTGPSWNLAFVGTAI